MASITMLGTGSALVTKCYNTCFVLNTPLTTLLVDAGGGNGVLTRLEQANIDIRSIHHAYLTHGHTDHILGMIWIVRKIAQMIHARQYTGTFTIYSHDQALQMLHTFCHLSIPPKFFGHVGKEIIFQQVTHGQQIALPDVHLQCFDIGSTKTKQFGFTATLPDGQRLACLGDEPYTPLCHDYVQSCHWLMCEAFCLYNDRDKFHPYEKHHSTALDAGKVAAKLQPRHLLLYHTEDRHLSTRAHDYAQEAAIHYSGHILVPDDLQTIPLD